MIEAEDAAILTNNPLSGAVCMARVEYMDQVSECPAKLRSDCPVCSSFAFVAGGSGQGFYYLPFTSDDEALVWGLTGHVRHKLVDISDGRLIPLVDKLLGLEMQKANLEARISAQFDKIVEVLPEWESAYN